MAQSLFDELDGSTPTHIVVMVYAEAITSLRRVCAAAAAGDDAARSKALTRSIELISLLYASLDMDHGGEIAENLSQLYRFILGRLVRIGGGRDLTSVHECIELLEPLHASWTALDLEPRMIRPEPRFATAVAG